MTDHSSARSLTDKLRTGELHSTDCPSREVFKHVSSLWGVLCLMALRDGTLRFSQLRRKATGVSEKMLAQTLKRLEEDGFILRFSHDVIPPKVEYSLTPMGEEISAHVAQLADWIEVNLDRVMACRDERNAEMSGA